MNDEFVKGKSIMKRNCIEIAPRALLLAAGVVLTVVLISVMINQFNSAQEMVNISSNMINERTENLKNGEILDMDGLEVSGSDVLNVCKKELGKGLNITLKNGSDSITYYEESSLAKLRDYESSEYIKPSTRWKCKVVKNKNGILTDIMFTRKGD